MLPNSKEQPPPLPSLIHLGLLFLFIVYIRVLEMTNL